MSDTPGRKFFNEHMQYIIAKDMAGMITNTYTEDAILYNAFPFLDTPPPNVIQGRDQLIKVFEQYLEYQGEIQVDSLYNFLETEDVISFQATITSSKTGKWAVGDIWIMQDQKIARHFGYAHSLNEQAEVEEFAKAWYKKLDVHDPLEEYKPLLTEDVELRFPEATVTGFEGYSDWYNKVINIFFDEVHTVKEVKITSSTPEKIDVKVVVKWEASLWKAPAFKSERIVLDAYQTWTLKRDPKTQKLAVSLYIVDELKYYEGSAKL
ncbi:MAG: hypothetical protein MGF17_00205 [Trichodesmium sp. MAG_R04]|nr:hypothetical protein [Trichodesmium sp. MAG_R04]